ncbi:hypothetical protein PUN28_016944 [Cardiocondyla obscurior]|uniref:Uncharacterized protein n=1 Tax=Cardiocondyla obscurior TaxID=286306 RepID=A0AAW2EJM2_9HYME
MVTWASADVTARKFVARFSKRRVQVVRAATTRVQKPAVFHSDCQDDEIALAIQAAEIANRNQIRAKFRSSEDLVHRISFVCIAGAVTNQLQTNFTSDLRTF